MKGVTPAVTEFQELLDEAEDAGSAVVHVERGPTAGDGADQRSPSIITVVHLAPTTGLVLTSHITGDSDEAATTIQAFRDGLSAKPSIVALDSSVLVSMRRDDPSL